MLLMSITFLSFVWVVSLIGLCVNAILSLSWVGEGRTESERRFWWNAIKIRTKWLGIFILIFTISNYLFYLLFKHQI